MSRLRRAWRRPQALERFQMDNCAVDTPCSADALAGHSGHSPTVRLCVVYLAPSGSWCPASRVSAAEASAGVCPLRQDRGPARRSVPTRKHCEFILGIGGRSGKAGRVERGGEALTFDICICHLRHLLRKHYFHIIVYVCQGSFDICLCIKITLIAIAHYHS